MTAEVGDEETTWRNAAGVPVITNGNPKTAVQVVVTEVSTPAPSATPSPRPAPSACRRRPDPAGPVTGICWRSSSWSPWPGRSRPSSSHGVGGPRYPDARIRRSVGGRRSRGRCRGAASAEQRAERRCRASDRRCRRRRQRSDASRPRRPRRRHRSILRVRRPTPRGRHDRRAVTRSAAGSPSSVSAPWARRWRPTWPAPASRSPAGTGRPAAPRSSRTWASRSPRPRRLPSPMPASRHLRLGHAGRRGGPVRPRRRRRAVPARGPSSSIARRSPRREAGTSPSAWPSTTWRWSTPRSRVAAKAPRTRR